MNEQFRVYFEGLKHALRAQSARASQLRSSTDIGNVREEFCEQFLKQFLPNNLLLTSGEVIDSRGGHTGQQDLVVYDQGVLRLGITDRTQILLAEGCLAVIEVKSSLDKAEFQKVLKKSKETKRLSPCLSPALPQSGHASYVTNAAEIRQLSRRMGLGDDGRVRKYIYPKFYCFAYKGPKRAETLSEWVDEDMRDSHQAENTSYEEWRDLFPDLICIMDTGAIYRNDGFAFELRPLVRSAPDGSVMPNDFYFLPTENREEVGAFAKHLLECADLRKRQNRLVSLGLAADIDAYFDV